MVNQQHLSNFNRIICRFVPPMLFWCWILKQHGHWAPPMPLWQKVGSWGQSKLEPICLMLGVAALSWSRRIPPAPELLHLEKRQRKPPLVLTGFILKLATGNRKGGPGSELTSWPLGRLAWVTTQSVGKIWITTSSTRSQHGLWSIVCFSDRSLIQYFVEAFLHLASRLTFISFFLKKH